MVGSGRVCDRIAPTSELEATREVVPEPQNGHERASEERGNGEVPPEQERVSWWRRVFFSV